MRRKHFLDFLHNRVDSRWKSGVLPNQSDKLYLSDLRNLAIALAKCSVYLTLFFIHTKGSCRLFL